MEYIRDNLISMHFDDVSELYESISNLHTIQNQTNKKHLISLLNETKNSIYWHGIGVSKIKEGIEKAVVGNPQMYAHIQTLMAQLDSQINVVDNFNIVPVIKRRKVRREMGDELDIQRVYQGKLDTAWSTTERVEVDQEHHLTTILVDIGGNSDKSAMNAVWTAAACLKFIEILERAGKQVQVIVGGIARSSTTTGKYMSVTCTVKKYNDHLNVERLAAMCHIGYYRAACFAGKMFSQETVVENLGHSENFSLETHRFKLPIPLHDEYKSGKTKIVLFEKALDIWQAKNSIERAQKNFLDNAGK